MTDKTKTITIHQQAAQRVDDKLLPAVRAHCSAELLKRTRGALLALAVAQPEMLLKPLDSLLEPLTKLAKLGLVPDNVEATITEYAGKPTAVPMAAGVRTAIFNLPGVAHCEVAIAYENDNIVYEPLSGKPPRIELTGKGLWERGKAVGVIAVAMLDSGHAITEILSADEIDKGWGGKKPFYAKQWGEEWWRNIAIKKLWRRLPMARAATGYTEIWDDADKEAQAVVVETTTPPQKAFPPADDKPAKTPKARATKSTTKAAEKQPEPVSDNGDNTAGDDAANDLENI